MSNWVNLKAIIVSQIENEDKLKEKELIQKIKKKIYDGPIIKGSEGNALINIVLIDDANNDFVKYMLTIYGHLRDRYLPNVCAEFYTFVKYLEKQYMCDELCCYIDDYQKSVTITNYKYNNINYCID